MCFGSITRQTGVRGMWFTGTGIWRRRRARLINRKPLREENRLREENKRKQIW